MISFRPNVIVTAPQTSSPLATGGAGTFFERDVNAYWLAQLLLRWIPPVLIDTNVIEVSFQTEHLGWKTDDFLITCEGVDVLPALIFPDESLAERTQVVTERIRLLAQQGSDKS